MRLALNKLLIEDEAYHYDLTRRIIQRTKGVEPLVMKKEELNDYLLNKADKRVLALKVQKNRFFHVCPGTKHYLCCGYYVLESGFNCPFNCSYCFLRFYQQQPSFIHFVNTGDLFHELSRVSSLLKKDTLLRVGTGEFTDSLALDPYTDFAREVILKLSELKNIIFEFKTKSDEVKSLLETETVPENIVVSWSMNPRNVIKSQEKDTASLERRLSAAAKIQEKGYLVGLHFDPMFYYSGWEEDYRNLVEEIFNYLDPKRIAWISLGIFRFQKNLSGFIFNENPNNPIIQNEFVLGKDGKNRLFIPLRYKMYSKMISWLKQIDQDLFIYLCMESYWLWERLFKNPPKSRHELDARFTTRLREIN